MKKYEVVGMSPGAVDVFERTSWCMQRAPIKDAAPWYEGVKIYPYIHADFETIRSLNAAEWDIVVRPTAPWTLCYRFDERAIPEELPDRETDRMFTGFLTFRADATVRDVLGAVAALPFRYGYFEGLKRVGYHHWELQFGT